MKYILRQKVKVVPTKEGGVYESVDPRVMVYPNTLRVNIEQLEGWIDDVGGEHTRRKRHYFDTDNPNLRIGDTLEGNIIRGYQTDPPLPEEYLYKRFGEIVCTESGKPIYSFLYYNHEMEYQPSGNVDELVLL